MSAEIKQAIDRFHAAERKLADTLTRLEQAREREEAAVEAVEAAEETHRRAALEGSLNQITKAAAALTKARAQRDAAAEARATLEREVPNLKRELFLAERDAGRAVEAFWFERFQDILPEAEDRIREELQRLMIAWSAAGGSLVDLGHRMEKFVHVVLSRDPVSPDRFGWDEPTRGPRSRHIALERYQIEQDLKFGNAA